MPVSSTLRRLTLLVLLAALGALVATRRRTRTTAVPAEPPSWPPLRTVAPTAQADRAAPEPEAHASWVAPLEDGSCPPDHPVKAKESSGIYHLPDCRFYERTKADRCYSDAAEAEADGYRRSKS